MQPLCCPTDLAPPTRPVSAEWFAISKYSKRRYGQKQNTAPSHTSVKVIGYEQTMSIWNILWAAFFGGSCLIFGTCALFAYFPGESLGVTMFAQLAERFGAVETGLGTLLVGLFLTIGILLSRPGGAHDGGIGFDGGCGGGD